MSATSTPPEHILVNGIPQNDAILLKEKEKIPYLLFYRQGNNPNPQFFVFFHPSHEIRQVVDRIKKHCELMNLRFVNVRPFVVDLDATEAKQFGATQTGTSE
jgi:hypothetical protein